MSIIDNYSFLNFFLFLIFSSIIHGYYPDSYHIIANFSYNKVVIFLIIRSLAWIENATFGNQ